MQAKDFKVGWTVRAITSGYVGPGLLQGETGVVACVEDKLVYVQHGRNNELWSMFPSELEVVKPRLQPSAADDLRLTPQARTVLRTMKRHGSISPAEALISLGISRLASCIHEIRARAGYVVDTVIRRDDHGHKYARYSLAKPATVH